MLFARQQSKIIMLSALILAIANAFSLVHPLIGIFALIGFLFGAGELIGPFLLPKNTRGAQTLVGILGVIASISILGSAVYYVIPVTKEVLALLLAIIAIVATLIGRHGKTIDPAPCRHRLSPASAAAYVAILIALAAWWSAVLPLSIVEAVRSPWLEADPIIIVALGIATIIAGALLARKAQIGAVATIGLIFFSATMITVVAYPLGYGFDPFIHRATIEHIAEYGTITPKPLYYIGQYALELVGLHIFSLPIKIIDNLLVSALASIFLTASAWIGFRSIMPNGGGPLLAVLLIPLSAFISTTPQALAYIFTGALIFLSLPRLFDKNGAPPMLTLWLLALAALITHPLAGIPAFIYAALVAAATWEQGTVPRKILVSVVAIIGAIALPIVFVVQAKMSGLAINFTLNNLFNFELLDLTGFFANRFSSWFDGLYLIIYNHLWILLIFATVGAWFARKYKVVWWHYVPLIAAFVWMINFWLLSTTLEFEFLIEYERANYSARLLTLTAISLVPHAGIAIAGIYKTLHDRPKILSTAFTILLGIIVTANIYGAYPRHDNYARSAGFNVAQSDIDTVYAINELGGDREFIVLANQAVSAAALQEFGFKKYFEGDIFYYPIPTGGELYEYYLDMTNLDPDRWRMMEAMDFTGVDLGFFVVNDYWWQADIIREHAKNEADDWFSIGEDDEVTVFIFEREGI
ncbi:MAG: hypothetical protein ABIA47_04605 [bacterium]